MCGISGCVIRDSSEVSSKSKSMLEALRHRGPDGNGYWSDSDNVLLCHTRLAIQDLSEAGKQPMVSSSQRYVITFNGEIYNFQELKKELLNLGHTFCSRTDTEVILTAIDEWGIFVTLKRLKGMFAFAVWDKFVKSLTLARDILGEKPLYYGWSREGFLFGSELKALKSISAGFELNELIIPDFLTLGYVPTPFTIYANLYKLTPGTFITFNDNQFMKMPGGFSPMVDQGETSPKPYWAVKDQIKSKNELIVEPQEVVYRIEETLMNSIRHQLISDVPVGAFLSGGIDSSLVVALMQKVSSFPVKTFTIGFHQQQFNEAKYAKQIAKHLETDHTEVYIDPDECLSIIDRLPTIYDEPFADPSQLPTIIVCEMARKSVTVCLSGDGGDELFAGYNRYISASSLLSKSSFLPAFLKKKLAGMLMNFNVGSIDAGYEKFRNFLGGDQTKQANVGLKLHKVAKLLQIEEPAELYGFLLRLNDFTEVGGKSKSIIEERIADCFSVNRDFVELAMLTDQLNYLPDDNLTKVDRAAMSCALETRLPLLDRDVVELSWMIPWQIKLREGKSKWPLRQVLYKYVPRKLIDRPKMGFSVPISAWIREELKDWSYELIQYLDCMPIARKNYWQALWDEHQTGHKDNGLALWPALMLSLWLQQTK